jgi:hypothetical protein
VCPALACCAESRRRVKINKLPQMGWSGWLVRTVVVREMASLEEHQCPRAPPITNQRSRESMLIEPQLHDLFILPCSCLRRNGGSVSNRRFLGGIEKSGRRA